MFLDFYQLREQPFGVTPNPAYLYRSQTHCAALDALSSGVRDDRGFLALIAEPGMGKTTLLCQLLEDLRDSARTVYLSQTQCESREFFQYILSDLNLGVEDLGLVAMHNKLNEILFAEMLSGKRFVLVVDEAQNLDESVLETVRLLSNFETQHTKLLQIVLAGQPQLADKLLLPRLRQLRQRIAVLSHLEPLSPGETARYVEHRLNVAGYEGEPLFDANALDLIASETRGIPRNINNLCYDSLSIAHAGQAKCVTADIVRRAVRRLNVESIGARAYAVAASAVRSRANPDAAHAAGGRPRASVPLTYKAPISLSLVRWVLIAAAVTGVLLLATANFSPLISLVRRSATRGLSSASAASATTVEAAISRETSLAYSAEPQDTTSGQLLTVTTEPGQTLRDLSLRYVGYFDARLLQRIRAVNPELDDIAHLSAGQLVRLPLPPGTLKKVR